MTHRNKSVLKWKKKERTSIFVFELSVENRCGGSSEDENASDSNTKMAWAKSKRGHTSEINIMGNIRFVCKESTLMVELILSIS